MKKWILIMLVLTSTMRMSNISVFEILSIIPPLCSGTWSRRIMCPSTKNSATAGVSNFPLDGQVRKTTDRRGPERGAHSNRWLSVLLWFYSAHKHGSGCGRLIRTGWSLTVEGEPKRRGLGSGKLYTDQISVSDRWRWGETGGAGPYHQPFTLYFRYSNYHLMDRVYGSSLWFGITRLFVDPWCNIILYIGKHFHRILQRLLNQLLHNLKRYFHIRSN